MFVNCYLIVILSFNCYQCFNIDTKSPIVYATSSNLQEPDYFGYSVALYPGKKTDESWVVVGAPKNHENGTGGACIKCRIRQRCEAIHIEDEGPGTTKKIDDAWIGGSMDINYDSGRVVTCAPRWIKVARDRNTIYDYRMQGVCYWFYIDDESRQKVLDVNDKPATYYNGNSAVYYFGQAQAGFAVHMPKKKKEVVLSAPGVYNWAGTTILFKDASASPPIASRLRGKKRRNRQVDEDLSVRIIADTIPSPEILAYDLFGYAITSGYFYRSSKLLYVSSAPRAHYNGKIIIYDFDKISEKVLDFKEVKTGKTFGEYFGGALTAGDVNNDGLDDLIVGAPFYTEKKYNEGKIYIFLGSKSGRLQTPTRDSIVGNSINGQFGTTLQFLGDIDHDGYGDVAVSAPYEAENSGVVYIFRGTTDGLHSQYSQRIIGSDLYEKIKGFGMSISRPADADHNGFSDIAVGAYLSGHVAFLRSSPVVTIYQDLTPSVTHLDAKQKEFMVTECFWYKLDQQTDHISINRTLMLDQQLGRAYLKFKDYNKDVDLSPNKKYCSNSTVELTNSFSNRYDPITITLSHSFLPNNRNMKHPDEILYIDKDIKGADVFCPTCPVYNTFGPNPHTTITIPFSLGCRTNICEASLSVEPTIPDLEDNTFTLGSKKYVALTVNITNFGEKAYLTQLRVTLPESVTFRSTPSACSQSNSSSVICSVDNPLDSNSWKLISLDLDMFAVNNGKNDSSLPFIIETITSSENDRPKVKSLIVKLKRDADVTISGVSAEHSYSFKNASENKQKFTQIYQIENFGISSLNEIVVEVNIPHSLRIDSDTSISFLSLYNPTDFIAEQDIVCRTNLTYFTENNLVSNEDSSLDAVDYDKSQENTRRSTREVRGYDNNASDYTHADEMKDNEILTLQNRTYYINCSMDQIICTKVECRAGPLKPGQVVNLKMRMFFNGTTIEDLLGKRDIISLSTHGRVIVTDPQHFIQSGERPDDADVVSLFIKESQSETVSLWIIIVSAVIGLLLLALLIFGLFKAGFFRRATKEELENLKKEIQVDDGHLDDLNDSEQ